MLPGERRRGRRWTGGAGRGWSSSRKQPSSSLALLSENSSHCLRPWSSHSSSTDFCNPSVTKLYTIDPRQMWSRQQLVQQNLKVMCSRQLCNVYWLRRREGGGRTDWCGVLEDQLVGGITWAHAETHRPSPFSTFGHSSADSHVGGRIFFQDLGETQVQLKVALMCC